MFDASISFRQARQPIWLTDYPPLCLRLHMSRLLLQLVDGLYFTLSQTHVLTAAGKTALTMGLVSRFPLLHLN